MTKLCLDIDPAQSRSNPTYQIAPLPPIVTATIIENMYVDNIHHIMPIDDGDIKSLQISRILEILLDIDQKQQQIQEFEVLF